MASNITLSAGVRQNLLALQGTADMLSLTQNRLATGKKVNSALDNPTNYFTSAALSARAGELSNLLDAMTNSINVLKAADNGLQAITKTIESMQATVTQARQDASWQSTSYTAYSGTDTTKKLSFSGGAVGTTAVDVDLVKAQGVLTGNTYTALDFNNDASFETLSFSIAANGGTARNIAVTATNDTTLSITVDGGTATTYTVADSDAVTGTELVAALNAAFDAATTPVAITASFASNKISFTADTAVSSSSASVTVTNVATTNNTVLVKANFGFDAGTTASTTGATAKSVDDLVSDINSNASLADKVKASNDAGKLRIQNLSLNDLTVAGVSAGAITGTSTQTDTIKGNSVRKNLVTQFNQLRDQLDKLADDASFNGINLLKGDQLKVVFNELATSSLTIQSTDTNGINNTVLGITKASDVGSTADDADFGSNTALDARLDTLHTALTTVRAQASAFGSNLSIVQNRQDFTKNMINTLQTGADGLVLADINEEGANMMALQTRQQLSIAALSLASQSQQAVLRLLG